MARKKTAATDTKRANGNAAERPARKPERHATAPRTITIRVALKLRQRGGRRLVITPNGTPQWNPAQQQRVDNTLVKALARAHRWKQLMESGRYTSVTDLAAAEKINDSYLCRLLRLTLLAPEILEAILDGGLDPAPGLTALLKSVPEEWKLQGKRLAIAAS